MWQIWRDEIDYKTWQNSETKYQVRISKYKGEWSLRIVNGDNQPIHAKDDLTEKQAMKLAKDYM